MFRAEHSDQGMQITLMFHAEHSQELQRDLQVCSKRSKYAPTYEVFAL
jgi:hypothetical protein